MNLTGGAQHVVLRYIELRQQYVDDTFRLEINHVCDNELRAHQYPGELKKKIRGLKLISCTAKLYNLK